MGSKPIGTPNDFSREVTGYVRQFLDGLSLRQAADVIEDMSHTYLGERLRDEKPFTTNDLAKIADAFGASPFDLIRGTATRDVGPVGEAAVLDLASRRKSRAESKGVSPERVAALKDREVKDNDDNNEGPGE